LKIGQYLTKIGQLQSGTFFETQCILLLENKTTVHIDLHFTCLMICNNFQQYCADVSSAVHRTLNCILEILRRK